MSKKLLKIYLKMQKLKKNTLLKIIGLILLIVWNCCKSSSRDLEEILLWVNFIVNKLHSGCFQIQKMWFEIIDHQCEKIRPGTSQNGTHLKAEKFLGVTNGGFLRCKNLTSNWLYKKWRLHWSHKFFLWKPKIKIDQWETSNTFGYSLDLRSR